MAILWFWVAVVFSCEIKLVVKQYDCGFDIFFMQISLHVLQCLKRPVYRNVYSKDSETKVRLVVSVM